MPTTQDELFITNKSKKSDVVCARSFTLHWKFPHSNGDAVILDQPDGSSNSADGDGGDTFGPPPQSPSPPRQHEEEEMDEAASAASAAETAEPSFTAMPTFGDVGDEGEHLRYRLYSSLMHGYNVGLRYIDDRMAAPPAVAEKCEEEEEEDEEEAEQYEEGSTPPEEEIPYEQIEERPEEIPYEQISSEQPEAEVSEDAAAIKKAVDAAIRAVASDTSLAREGSDEEVMNRLEGEPEPEPEPKPEHEQATKVTVQMYRTEEPRVIGSPPSYRRVESQRAANSKVKFRITSLCMCPGFDCATVLQSELRFY